VLSSSDLAAELTKWLAGVPASRRDYCEALFAAALDAEGGDGEAALATARRASDASNDAVPPVRGLG
jgi:hypothetical protein